MDVNQLEVLIAVAKEQSFSRAAQSLHRTQPAVSQAIRRLETELGSLCLTGRQKTERLQRRARCCSTSPNRCSTSVMVHTVQ